MDNMKTEIGHDMKREIGKKLPRARKEGLLIQELPEEVLVFDLSTAKAHCLNHTAALVWRRCDGKTSIAEVTKLLQKEGGTHVDAGVVLLALDQLEKARLIEEGSALSDRDSRAKCIAARLEGAWRGPPPHLDFPRDGLAAVTPYLLKSASAPLAWRRIRNTALRSSGEALELQQAYRLHALQAAMHDRNLERLVSCLTSSGIRPLLGKGWAVARLYPEPGLRPYGDFDFYVNPDQRSSS